MIGAWLGLALAAAAAAEGDPDIEAGHVSSEAPAPIEGTLAAVRVTGLRRVEEAAILDAMGLHAGDVLQDWKLQRDIRAIWRTGFVSDVAFKVLPVEGGLELIVEVKEKPAVRSWRLAGNTKVKEDELKEAIDIEPFTVPSDARIAANVRAIKDKYLEKGFYLAEITPELQPLGDDMVELVFSVVENRKVLVQSIDITGNEHVPDAKIRRYLSTKQAGVLPWLTNTGTFVEESLQDDVYIVRQVLLEEGFVDAQVDEPRVYLSPDKRHIFVSIHVTEGPEYSIGRLEPKGDFLPEEGLTKGAVRALLAGATLKDVQAAFARAQAEGQAIDENWEPKVERRFLDFAAESVPLKTGDRFKLSTMQMATQRVSDLYGDQGYAFANVVPLPRPDPDSKLVDIAFDIQRGEKMRISRINITGNVDTHDKVVRREVPQDEGDIYKGSLVRSARQRLERLGFFETVNITTPRAEEPDELDMNVDVTERPTGSFTIGAGFSSVDSFLLTAAIQKNNFLGLGWLASLNLNVSRPTQQASIDFFDPYFLDSRWTLRLNGFYTQRSYLENEYARGGLVEIGRYVDRGDDVRLSLQYTGQDNGLLYVDEYKSRLYGGQLYRSGLASSLGIALDVDKRNNRINATRGMKLRLETSLAGGLRISDEQVLSLFGGDFNFWESKANFRFYQPLVKNDWIVFKYNLSLGHIQGTDGTVVPFVHRYRAGGITSVRGFEPFALGPSVRATGFRDYSNPRSQFYGSDDPTAADDRLVIGGTEVWVNNFELESPIVKEAGISLVTFFDAGNAFGDAEGNGTFDPLGLRTSVGFGIRWFSPIGPLRFEWGFPLEPYPDERTAVFDFTIGSAF